MISNFLQGTVYSTGLSCFFFSSLPADNWNFRHAASIVGFWNIFTIPFGMFWNNFNEKVLKKFGFQTFQMRRAFINKKFLMIDLAMNHIVYQLIFVGAFYNYLNQFFPNEKIFANNNKKIENIENNAEGIPNIVKDIVFLRVKLSMFSFVCDIWFSKTEDLKSIKMIKIKNFGVQMIWHLYLIHKYFAPENNKKNVKF